MINISTQKETSVNQLLAAFKQAVGREFPVQYATIREGDIFQVVLSNPSPYMFYFSSYDMELVGASPETLVKLEDGRLHTFPLAGTRPRGKTREEDLALEKELLADEKELSEHNMLVDLGRNDIGKISRIGSVEVEKYLSIERFSHVMHIGSTVAGRIRRCYRVSGFYGESGSLYCHPTCF